MNFDAPLHINDASREVKADHHPLPANDPLYRTLFDDLAGMAYLARADRARTVEITSAGSHELLGFKPDHKPFSLAPLIHPEDREQVLEMIEASVTGNHSFAIEYRLRHASGKWHTVWEQGHPVQHGHHPAVQGYVMDVSQRIHMEHARLSTELRLLQAQKFQAINLLASGVAHEFNNMIAGILGSAELLAMDIPESHPGHETLKQIFEASNHARDFVHKLRTLGQRPTLEFKPVRLQAIIEECLQILRSIIPAKVELHLHLDPECPKVHADAAHIQQALMELCLYSWQGLADRRGRIKISLEHVPVVHLPPHTPNTLQPGPHVCLTVQDDSPGLDKSAREHIFHPFRSRRAGGKKVGLELFLVREAIQAHLGEIVFASEPGQGLTFLVYLPVAREK